MKEVKIVNNLLPNVKLNSVSLTSVNKLFYVGSYVVCEQIRLAKEEKRKETRKTMAVENI